MGRPPPWQPLTIASAAATAATCPPWQLGSLSKPSRSQLSSPLGTGRDGLTPLHHACLDVDQASTAVVQRLLDAGADPSVGDGDGTTCLHIAASLANVKLAKILINSELGADTNAPDNQGSTPLHFAVQPIQEARDADVQRCIKLLLEHGAKPEKKDKEGKRPADLARADEVKKLLAGADADELGATAGTSRRRRRGNESSDDVPAAGGRADEEEGQAGGRRRRRPGAVASAMEQVRSEVFSAVGSRTDQRRRRRQGEEGGQQGDAALEGMLAQHEEREERRMMEQLSSQAEDVQWDLALELLPEYAAQERGERDHELESLEAGGRELLSPQLLVARVKAAHVGLQTKLISHPGGGGQLFLVVGAGLGRLAKEADRIGMVAQLKPEIEKRMVIDKAAELGREVTELSQSKYGDAELSEACGGREAYAPYRRAVHRYFQMAAPPHFFACSQRTQLLTSILHAPRDAGGAGLSLAQLQRDKVISKAFPLHDQDERKALEDRWGVEAALALAPAPLAQLFNYFGAEYALALWPLHCSPHCSPHHDPSARAPLAPRLRLACPTCALDPLEPSCAASPTPHPLLAGTRCTSPSCAPSQCGCGRPPCAASCSLSSRRASTREARACGRPSTASCCSCGPRASCSTGSAPRRRSSTSGVHPSRWVATHRAHTVQHRAHARAHAHTT